MNVRLRFDDQSKLIASILYFCRKFKFTGSSIKYCQKLTDTVLSKIREIVKLGSDHLIYYTCTEPTIQ